MAVMYVMFFASLVASQSCPQLSCATGTGSDDVCAKLSGGQINLSKCDNGYQCNLADLLDAIRYGVTATDEIEVKCSVTPRSKFSIGENTAEAVTKMLCSRQTDTTLRKSSTTTGTHKSCTTAADCLASDGTAGDCVCGINGSAYCVPFKGDTAYTAFYKAACDFDEKDSDEEKQVDLLLGNSLYINLHAGLSDSDSTLRSTCFEKELFADYDLYMSLIKELDDKFKVFDDDLGWAALITLFAAGLLF